MVLDAASSCAQFAQGNAPLYLPRYLQHLNCHILLHLLVHLTDPSWTRLGNVTRRPGQFFKAPLYTNVTEPITKMICRCTLLAGEGRGWMMMTRKARLLVPTISLDPIPGSTRPKQIEGMVCYLDAGEQFAKIALLRICSRTSTFE